MNVTDSGNFNARLRVLIKRVNFTDLDTFVTRSRRTNKEAFSYENRAVFCWNPTGPDVFLIPYTIYLSHNLEPYFSSNPTIFLLSHRSNVVNFTVLQYSCPFFGLWRGEISEITVCWPCMCAWIPILSCQWSFNVLKIYKTRYSQIIALGLFFMDCIVCIFHDSIFWRPSAIMLT